LDGDTGVLVVGLIVSKLVSCAESAVKKWFLFFAIWLRIEILCGVLKGEVKIRCL